MKFTSNKWCGASLRRRFCLGLAGVALIGVWTPPTDASAGGGRFSNGEFNFCVSVRFDATDAQLADIRQAFQNGSDVLADATDGQHRFGTITLVNDSGASQSSEYWVHAGPGRAYTFADQYGVRGQHVNLYFDANFQQNDGADGDAYTIAHEHVHIAYGVRDEYQGPGGVAECSDAANTSALTYSLMDNYFTRGGRATATPTYTLNELCVASNHDPDGDTYQDSVHGESAWETIASHPTRSAVAPAGLPVDAAPASQAVTFVDGFGGLRVMLVLDRSGSMLSQQRMDFAKLGAKQFTATFDPGDAIGVASFASSAGTNFPLTEIVDATTVAAADTAIDSLSAGGATNIGGGLHSGMTQITSQTERSCNELIVLLSDGDHNTGTPPGAVTPQLQDEGITVITVGVGAGISTAGEASLQATATATGGQYFRVASSADLVGLFSQLAAEATGSGLLTRAPLSLSEHSVAEVVSLVEDGAESATFVVALANAGDDVELELVDPAGRVITVSDASTDPGIEYTSDSNSRKFDVTNPLDGVWTMRILTGSLVGGDVEALSFAKSSGMALFVDAQSDTVEFPDAVVIRATPTARGEAVVGAVVEGIVKRPNAPDVTIELFDDGDTSNGDDVAGDGVYSGTFGSYSDDGTYTFEMTAMAIGASTYGGEWLFDTDPDNTAAVPDFERSASLAVVVTGVPPYIPATVEYGPETINLKSQGQYVTAYIELPDLYDVSELGVGDIAITEVDGAPVEPLFPLARPSEIGDFDNDGNPDLMVKFSRAELQARLSEGERAIRLEANWLGVHVVGDRTVTVKNPGKAKP